MDSATPFQPWADEESVKNVKSEKELLDDAKLRQENVIHPKHTQTASYDKESNANPIIPTESYCLNDPREQPVRDRESKMDSNKIASMQHIVENTISQEGKQRVAQILEAVDALNGPERLLLYLRLPTGVPPHDPLKQPINPLGSRAELQQTVTWIQTHLEVDPDVSLPKQDVYDEYIAHCMSSNMKPLSTADFGKVMKQVYPTVRPRRLGTRGNSRYCYAGLRKKIKLEVPQLPDLGETAKELRATCKETERIVCDWAEMKLGLKLSSLTDLARHLSSSRSLVPPPPAPLSPPQQSHGSTDDPASRQLMKQLKRKIQGQGTPGRPKKNKAVEGAGRSPPGTAAGASVAWGAWGAAQQGVGEPPPRAHDAWRAPAEPAPLPMNLSSDASLDLRRRPPLPGKKLILEQYRAASPPPAPPPLPPPAPLYLPKKMRAADLARADPPPPPPPPAPPHMAPAPLPPPALFLDDPKNSGSRSTSTAAALAREEHAATPSDPSDALDDVICGEKHAEILNRERVISICNIDKHDLDDYLHENSSQEHEEELLQYFQRREADGKSEKISQLRELLERNLRGGEQVAPPPPSNGHAHGGLTGGGRYDFVPIACEGSLQLSPAGAVSPFVSPRLTPCRRRGGQRAAPLAPLAPHTVPPAPHLATLHAPPLSADALSNEVSHFFAESLRSQSAPPKPPPLAALSYTSTPVGSVPPTPVPHEFCDFEACDISRAGLNPETLDKIYDAIDASADVLGVDALLPASRSVPCTPLPPGAADAASKSVPATPHLPDSVFCYNRDFLINGHGFPNEHPLHDIMDPAADLLAELDAPPIVYPDL